MRKANIEFPVTDLRASGTDLVQNYLDSLLRDVSAELALADAEVLANEQLSQADLLIADVNLSAAEPIVVNQIIVEQAALADTNQLRDIPGWGKQGFASLIFDVAGLKMAAPLHALGGISLLENRLQPLVAQADWFMGLLRWNGRNLRVVDTARLLMPERLHDNNHRVAYQSVIVLGDSHWALAVDKADESVHLKASDVRWKLVAGTRPWLAGTLLQRLCALIDVDHLLGLLEQGELSTGTGTGTGIDIDAETAVSAR